MQRFDLLDLFDLFDLFVSFDSFDSLSIMGDLQRDLRSVSSLFQMSRRQPEIKPQCQM